MTPKELQKQLTMLLAELLNDTGFRKGKIGELRRVAGECEQFFNFQFTRDRGLPGNLYSLGCSLSFKYRTVDQLTSYFMGMEYDKKWGTGALPFYVLIPDRHVVTRKYCVDKELKEFAEEVAHDFGAYALQFYDSFDTIDKLEEYFDKFPKYSKEAVYFSVIRNHARGCCVAAVYCINGKYDKLKDFLCNTDELSDGQKRMIMQYCSDHPL